jgi:hypothetical protein
MKKLGRCEMCGMHTWIDTKERAPQEKDANQEGGVLAYEGKYPGYYGWEVVAEYPNRHPIWMPIPECLFYNPK